MADPDLGVQLLRRTAQDGSDNLVAVHRVEPPAADRASPVADIPAVELLAVRISQMILLHRIEHLELVFERHTIDPVVRGGHQRIMQAFRLFAGESFLADQKLPDEIVDVKRRML